MDGTPGDSYIMVPLGISIVFAGMVFLSLVIACIPRFLRFWDIRIKNTLLPYLKVVFAEASPETIRSEIVEQKVESTPGRSVEETLREMSKQLGHPFKLPELLRLAEKAGIDRPYSQVNNLLLCGTLLGGTNGLFRWKERAR